MITCWVFQEIVLSYTFSQYHVQIVLLNNPQTRVTLYFLEGCCQENVNGLIFINLHIRNRTLMIGPGVFALYSKYSHTTFIIGVEYHQGNLIHFSLISCSWSGHHSCKLRWFHSMASFLPQIHHHLLKWNRRVLNVIPWQQCCTLWDIHHRFGSFVTLPLWSVTLYLQHCAVWSFLSNLKKCL